MQSKNQRVLSLQYIQYTTFFNSVCDILVFKQSTIRLCFYKCVFLKTTIACRQVNRQVGKKEQQLKMENQNYIAWPKNVFQVIQEHLIDN